jgi:hypothetical protein
MSDASSRVGAVPRVDLVIVTALGLLAIVFLMLLRAMMLDDAYITYSYSRNFARTGQLLYHPAIAYFSTTAPLYGVLLGLPARYGLSIPEVSDAFSAASIFGSSVFVYLLFRRHQARIGGLLAALLILTSPLLWLSLGLETCWLLFLICGAFYCSDAGRSVLTGFLLGLATLTRGDALIATAIVILHHVFVLRRPIEWKGLIAYLAIVLPFLAYLVVSFGSPLPETMYAKQAQARLGISGFYTDTSLVEGLGIMWRGWLNQSLLYLLIVPALALGAIALPKARWGWGIVAWGLVHLAAYMILGVTPYFWYYAPVVVTMAATAGLGLQWLDERLRSGWAQTASIIAGALLVGAQIVSLQQISAGITGPVLADSDPNSKVLPGINGALYRQVGDWLNANTLPSATVGVTEVGIIGFYADRLMIDFLGVLWPDVARALQRGDLYFSIPNYMPDYLVLGSDLGTFGLSLAKDDWFLGNYQPVVSIEDPVKRLSPLVVLQRTREPASLVEHTVEISIGEDISLTGYAVEEDRLLPGEPVRVRMDLLNKTGEPHRAKTIAYLNGPDGSLVTWAERDENTIDWLKGEVFSLYHMFRLPADAPPGLYQFGIRVIVDDGKFDEAHHLVQYEIGATK